MIEFSLPTRYLKNFDEVIYAEENNMPVPKEEYWRVETYFMCSEKFMFTINETSAGFTKFAIIEGGEGFDYTIELRPEEVIKRIKESTNNYEKNIIIRSKQ